MGQRFDPTSRDTPDRQALNRANAASRARQEGLEVIDEERMATLLADLQGAGYIRGDLGFDLNDADDLALAARAAMRILRG